MLFAFLSFSFSVLLSPLILSLLLSPLNYISLLVSFSFFKLFSSLNFIPLALLPSGHFLSFSLFNYKYLNDFSIFSINRHNSCLNCKGIETNNLNKSLQNKTDTHSNLSKELSDFNNIKMEGSSINLDSISKSKPEILKTNVRQKDTLNTVGSKDFISNKSDKVEYNNLANSETKKNKAGSSKNTIEDTT